jgi:hypothetical protein
MTGTTEYFVAPSGDDTATGSLQSPFRTIQRAADVMLPGDTCTVREGVYREWVSPPRGGSSEERRITYRAADGERVTVRGSERIASWVQRGDGIWLAELPDALFGDFNPFRRNLSGEWLHYGQEYHLGSVYLDGAPLQEKCSPNEVHATAMTFWIEAEASPVRLHANFGPANPNEALAEVSTRECIFFPRIPGLGFITVDGIRFEHASANWAAWRCAQRGAVGTNWGWRWVIRNCRIADARCVGLVCGNEASSEYTGFDLAAVGGHVVRNNHILRCGQAGIHGFKGWGGSVIENNLIEDINVHREFGGEETAGIKLHSPVDITVRNNVLRRICARRVPGRNNDFVAIWIDWAGQGTRVTGNVVYDVEAWALYLQNNHGAPIIVDNNVFAGAVASSSAGCVFAHNLFAGCRWIHYPPYERVPFWKPHSAEPAGIETIAYRDNRYFNNIFVGGGTDGVREGPGVETDWNVFYDGAIPSSWGDRHSRAVSGLAPDMQFHSSDHGVEILCRFDQTSSEVHCPIITPERIGTFSLTGQRLENPDSSLLVLDRDITGQARASDGASAGPFEQLEVRYACGIKEGP